MTEIAHPRRVLAVSLAESSQTLSRLIERLTGTAPSPAPSLAGVTHLLPLRTPYYAAAVPVWLDLVPAGAPAAAAWAAAFLSVEAAEVLRALGALVVVFALPGGPDTRELVAQVGTLLRDGLGGSAWDGVGLAVGVEVGAVVDGVDGDKVLDQWEDVCAAWGLEFVHVAGGGDRAGAVADGQRRNEFGERVGVARVLEALQANDWSGGGGGAGEDVGLDGPDDDEFGDLVAGTSAPGGRAHAPVPPSQRTRASGDGDDDTEDGAFAFAFDPPGLDFALDGGDVAGLRKAIWDGGQAQADGEDGLDDGGPGEEEEEEEEEEVQKLGRMMQKLQAVRDLTAGMPDEQRRRLAKRAVGEVMRDMS
ncbi:hypothetical protein P8C59_008311 [Phyllachora maydis]|uniref:Alpha and gamma adaptin binding protein p34 n=1 Tax=Phyllachora maydis TaxID=1825666 RepID=A0AAD9IA95_9PEZI|nr:hypothetical protein P8C59_008311 [Phyllachora maydis]